MVHPAANEIRRLKLVAREIFETGDESGYLVGVATGQHKAFRRSRRPSSALGRELYLDAARRAGSREGFGIETASGGGLDLVSVDGTRIRKYRVKAGERTPDGGYRFVCGLGSTLLTAECDSMYVEERWLLGYIPGDDHTLDEVIAAEVVGSTGNGPVTLILGTIVDLSVAPPPESFTSTDEGLDGFDDGDEAGEADVA